MPFLLVTGHPSSGKSTIVDRIVEFLKQNQDKYEVVLIRDDSFGGFSRDIYSDSNKEKLQRGLLRSSVQKELSRSAIVICDGLNYIKGFRYELFLLGKLAKTTYAVLQVKATESSCSWLNEQKQPTERYEPKTIKELYMKLPSLVKVETGRIENERGNSESEVHDLTMDLDHPSPRYVPLLLSELKDWLCEGSALVQNASTSTAPLAPPDLMHLLDNVTQEVSGIVTVMVLQVVNTITAEQQIGIARRVVVIPAAEEGANDFKCTRTRTIGELSRLRRQFISLNKATPVANQRRVASLFISFLNSTP